MHTMTATEIKTNFGKALLDSMQSPITIKKNNREVAVLMSIKEYKLLKNFIETEKTQKYIGIEKSNKLVEDILNS
jgi:prevent-host-death family protein